MTSVLRSFARRRPVRVSALVTVVAISLSGCLPPAPPAPPAPATPSTAPTNATDPLPAPGWWSGSCDDGNYAGASPLGASYRGVIVCGPRPGADGAPNRLVNFFPGAWGELEWQCVELSMRFLYLAYGVAPYGADGKDVVDNYTPAAGGGLVKITNGSQGTAPTPGDVISFGPTSTRLQGHTGVVASANVDANGNGTIRILSQNDTVDGWRDISVTNWLVNGPAAGLGSVTGWLHKPTS
jgi:hypothetical protein